MITLDQITHRYPNGMQALSDISLTVKSHETLVLIGGSGCGKSTLLKMVNGLIRPTRGQILWDDVPLDRDHLIPLRRRIGYVIQQVGLFPHLTVAENIGLVARFAQWSRAQIDARVETLLELVGLDPRLQRDKYPHQLSGGEAQRIGIARALLFDPMVLLMDEPFGAFDPVLRTQLQHEFLSLEFSLKKTIVLVTHDIQEAFLLGDRIAFMDRGRLLQVGTAEELKSCPANDAVSAFVGGIP
ncbi:MAG: ATP-binding cassette domain-containing protein [Deltaproteobacteria bacterium]|nr:ATP-binding cassette domain-containing protein [Deltaproteobacteria bacterium]